MARRWSRAATVGGVTVRLVKPQTYMNLSGAGAQDLLRRPFWSAANDLLVVVDEVALPVGRIASRARGQRRRTQRLKSVEPALGNRRSTRGCASASGRGGAAADLSDLADFVLAPFARMSARTISWPCMPALDGRRSRPGCATDI